MIFASLLRRCCWTCVRLHLYLKEFLLNTTIIYLYSSFTAMTSWKDNRPIEWHELRWPITHKIELLFLPRGLGLAVVLVLNLSGSSILFQSARSSSVLEWLDKKFRFVAAHAPKLHNFSSTLLGDCISTSMVGKIFQICSSTHETYRIFWKCTSSDFLNSSNGCTWTEQYSD